MRVSTHTPACAHTRTGSSSLCFSCHLIRLPFVWISVLYAIGFEFAVWNKTMPWWAPHILLISHSHSSTGLFVSHQYCWFVAHFRCILAILQIHEPMHTEADRHTNRPPFYLTPAAGWAVWWPTRCFSVQHINAAKPQTCKRTLMDNNADNVFFSRSVSHMQTHSVHCDWFRTSGAELAVSDASLLMYPDEIITQPLCSSAGQPVS